jgi:hypothetical protein
VLAFILDESAEWPKDATEGYRLAVAAERADVTPELASEVQRKIKNLSRFKKWLQARSICAKFKTADSLKANVEAALREWRTRHRDLSDAPVARRDGTRDPRTYLEQLREQTAWIDIRGLQVSSGKAHRFSIEDLYIPLTAVPGAQELNTWGMLVPTTGQLDGTRRKPIELQAALTYPRLVIVGDPGAGKTTFLRRIGYALSDSILNSGMRTSAHLSSDEMPSPTPEDRKKGLFIERLIRLLSGTDPVRPQPKEARPFPIFIRIAELAEHIDRSVRQTGRRQPTTRESPEWLLDFLNTRNNELNWSLRTDFFREKLKDTNCVLLLDGLDEATRRSERESMSRLFEQATRAFSKCRFVVTTRPLAYTGLTVLDNFQTARVEPIEQEAIHDFLQYWCRSLFPDSESAAGQHLNELSDALRTPEIKRMASNPVMLTALAVVHWNERRLPEQRVDLYESILNWLARAREKRTGRPSPERCLALLQELALAMQNHPTGRQSQVSRGWATAVLAERFIGLAEADRNEQAAEFLEQEEVDSGIIVSRGSDLRFWHLTFQEYLAARAMGGRPDSAQHALLLVP